jgi:hypothetical protein
MEQLGSHGQIFISIDIYEYVSKIYRQNSSFINVQESRVFYMKTYLHLW